MLKPLYILSFATLLVGCSTIEPPPLQQPKEPTVVQQTLTYKDILEDFLFAYDETQGDIDKLYEIMSDLPPEWQYRLMVTARDIANNDTSKLYKIDAYISEIKKSITAKSHNETQEI